MEVKNIRLRRIGNFGYVGIFFMIVGLLFPLWGGIMSYDAEVDYSRALEDEDWDKVSDARFSMFVGSTIQAMGAPMIFFGIGLILAGMLAIKIPPVDRKCPVCMSWNLGKFNYCYQCGHDFKERHSAECPSCNKPVQYEQAYCNHCGEEIGWESDEKKKIKKKKSKPKS